MRPLVAVPADPMALLPALRAALAGEGPALLPYPVDGPAPADLPSEVPKRVAVVIETSGSAGKPKRVALSADALLAGAAMTEAALGGPGRWLLALPAHYIAGLQVLVRSIASGNDPEMIDPGAQPEEFAAALQRFGDERRYTALVPAQVDRLLAAAGSDPSVRAALRGVDRALVGGQSLPQTLADRADEIGLAVTRTYGSSETAGGCVYDGRPLGSTLVKIVDGEIWLSTPALAEGYLDDAERTAAVFVTDEGLRWYRTGDDGALDDGRLRVSGRRDDVVISGGEKVSLGLVEAAVREHPGLESAVVVAGEDPHWGQVPVLVSTVQVDLDAVRDHVIERLGRAAGPRRGLVLDRIPLLASGKPDRPELRRLVAEEESPVVHVTALLVGDGTGRTLLVRKRGSRLFMQPGGKPEVGETAADCGVRELREELGIEVDAVSLRPLGEFRAPAANEEGHDVIAQSFSIDVAPHELSPLAEIAEALWVTPEDAARLPLAPLTRDHLLPLLTARPDGDPRIGE